MKEVFHPFGIKMTGHDGHIQDPLHAALRDRGYIHNKVRKKPIMGFLCTDHFEPLTVHHGSKTVANAYPPPIAPHQPAAAALRSTFHRSH
jgi:hypothetical protein